MAKLINIVLISVILSSCNTDTTRVIEDFNFNWKFAKGEFPDAFKPEFDDSSWDTVRLPHDWSILASYKKDNTAASTGFVEGGIGWYRKTFTLPTSDKEKNIWIEFDGVFCNSEVWVNGHHLGFRPNGYSSFSYKLSEHLNYGSEPNTITVKADHSAYADTRWYTGSGIYRNVRLVKTSPIHIPQWGVRVTTLNANQAKAELLVETLVESDRQDIQLDIQILDKEGKLVAQSSASERNNNEYQSNIGVITPQLWSPDSPNLYTVVVTVSKDGKATDQTSTKIGIRTINFDANTGFSINGNRLKIKGVNLHHDAGAVGAAVPKAIWEYRVKKLKSIGVNAIRMSHNPHSVELMDVCDEEGVLVMNEFFDEWHKPKGKNLVYLGDNAAKGDIAKGYSEYFLEWAERDLKDLIARDYNHPSVIMWSIGNEIEWTFPNYNKAYEKINPKAPAYGDSPIFDPEVVKPVWEEITGGVDSLAIVANLLSKWVKEEDTTRPVTCGSVRPSIAANSGYSEAVDVLGFNYRDYCYDVAHETFPDLKIIGSENWVAYSEWKAINERDFVSGIFVWTGFAYLGEAGPWPRKGLNISLFDYAGFQTPRGHFFECLWKEAPKVYMVTTPASESEYSYTEEDGWEFEMQMSPPPLWGALRKWEWYKVNRHWNYDDKEPIIVQTYTNCQEAELFLNGESLGKQKLADFVEDDNIIKWLTPFTKGELKVVGYNNGQVAHTYIVNSTLELGSIKLTTDKANLEADNYDVSHVKAQLYDTEGNLISDMDTSIVFDVHGAAELMAIDNGWEMNVEPHYKNNVTTHEGRALAIVRSTSKKGTTTISAKVGNIISNDLEIVSK